jgi:SUKH-4 immunity protein
MTSSTLPDSAVLRLPIPDSAKLVLSTRGVPDDLRLPGWQGPTLFTSEIREGYLRGFSQLFSLSEQPVPSGFVIGTIRETMGASPGEAYAVFTLTGDGRVVLVDLVGDHVHRFVNSSLERFLDSLTLFLDAWPGVSLSDGAATAAAVVRLHDLMTRLDPAAWDSAHHYWPTWFEELEL